MKVYKIQRTWTINIAEDIIAHSREEALEIAEEFDFPMSEGTHIVKDRVLEVGMRVTEDSDQYKKYGGYHGSGCVNIWCKHCTS
jgi:hypothetical protein